MIRTFAILAAAVLFLVPPALGQEPEWVDLFDGQTLKGWTQRGGKAEYQVEDGQIVGSTVPNTSNSFLCTDKHYSDFVLELEFKVDRELNSGVQIRSNSLPDYKNGVVHGYQVEIDASDRAWTAGIYDESRRGWLNDLTTNDRARYAFKQNDWNQLRVLAIGDRMRTWLNGVPAANLNDSETASGFIALQVHGVGGRTDPLQVRWRNIRLKHADKDDQLDYLDIPFQQGSFGQSSLVKDDMKVVKLGDGFIFTEGPALGADGRLYFSDIPNQRINVFNPETKEFSVAREESGRSNGLVWTPNDALVACEGGNRRVTWHLPGEEIQVLAQEFDGKKLNSPNDLVLDGVGGLYFTDPRYGDRKDMEMEVEGVYYLNRGRQISRVVDDMTRPNGLILSHDNKTLYIADAGAGLIWAYDVSGPGKLSNKRKFADIGSDGMTIDERGNIYCTQGQVHIFSSQGELLEQIDVPESPSNVTFGGPGNKTLYITARTGLYSLEMNVAGGRAFANPQ